VAVAATIEVNFRLLDPWSVSRETYKVPAMVSGPSLREFHMPQACKRNPAEIAVALQIGPEGDVAQARIVSSTNSSLDRSVIQAVGSWVFFPAKRDGVAEAAVGEIELACRPRR
jgi:TonB family protein